MAIKKDDLILAADVDYVNYLEIKESEFGLVGKIFEEQDKTFNFYYNFPPQHHLVLDQDVIGQYGENSTTKIYWRIVGDEDWIILDDIGDQPSQTVDQYLNNSRDFKELRLEDYIEVPAFTGGTKFKRKYTLNFTATPAIAIAGEHIRAMSSTYKSWGSNTITVALYNQGRVGYE
jgi:hypothetical protein